MPVRTNYSDGHPCWVDYAASDPARSRDFYRDLFNWSFDEPESSAGYRMARLGGEIVAGFGRAPAGRAMWTTYLASGDVGATAALLTARGGTVLLGPVAAGDDGRLLLAADPLGVVVGFWEGHAAQRVLLVDEPGATCRHDLWAPTGLHDRLRAWYDGLSRVAPVIPPAGAAPQWVPCFQVGDCMAATLAAVQAGARVAGPPLRSDGEERILLRDPWQEWFAIVQKDPSSQAAKGFASVDDQMRVPE
jgi:predicted enzyme related to lactoylglutathione lyase